ncbi:hypothetical protein KJ758_01230 [Patescibacteria group bacterium]|nr:hypothetical protein [Patescibacteria group bacterium]
MEFWLTPKSTSYEDGYGVGDQLRSLGIAEHAHRISAFSNEDFSHRLSVFLADNSRMLARLEETDEVARLDEVGQIGVKSDAAPGHVYPHSRLEHSRLGVSYIAVHCSRMGLHYSDSTKRSAAMMLHDLGHSALSHQAERALQLAGHGDHEDRGQHILRGSPGLQAVLMQDGRVYPNDLLPIMSEKGVEGVAQSIFDSLSWVVMDSAMAGRPLPEDFEWRVISSIVREDWDGLVVDDHVPLQELLERRVELFPKIYVSLRGRVSNASVHEVVRLMLRQKKIVPNHLMQGIDNQVLPRIQGYLINGAPEYIKSAWQLGQGYVDESDRWELETFSNESDFRTRVVALSTDDVPHLASNVYPFWKKAIPVKTTAGARLRLQAEAKDYSGLERLYFILVFKG